nr:hypothetical protein [Tanacetum cinerariifolium]
KDTLREALQITPVNNNQEFVAPPSSDALITFVNELGYPKLVRNVSNDKWNLSPHTTGKKKATLIVIPSIRFTKLIIHHLQRRHKFHLRPDSLLYLPNEEPVLRYLKFSVKEVPRKSKEKVTEEQVAHDLLNLQNPKKKSLGDQYILQRRVSEPTGSFGHDKSPYDVLRQSESEEESEKVVLGADKGGQDEGQAGPDPGAQSEG